MWLVIVDKTKKPHNKVKLHNLISLTAAIPILMDLIIEFPVSGLGVQSGSIIPDVKTMATELHKVN